VNAHQFTELRVVAPEYVPKTMYSTFIDGKYYYGFDPIGADIIPTSSPNVNINMENIKRKEKVDDDAKISPNVSVSIENSKRNDNVVKEKEFNYGDLINGLYDKTTPSFFDEVDVNKSDELFFNNKSQDVKYFPASNYEDATTAFNILACKKPDFFRQELIRQNTQNKSVFYDFDNGSSSFIFNDNSEVDSFFDF
jgi:hypothetical protein